MLPVDDDDLVDCYMEPVLRVQGEEGKTLMAK